MDLFSLPFNDPFLPYKTRPRDSYLFPTHSYRFALFHRRNTIQKSGEKKKKKVGIVLDWRERKINWKKRASCIVDCYLSFNFNARRFLNISLEILDVYIIPRIFLPFPLFYDLKTHLATFPLKDFPTSIRETCR